MSCLTEILTLLVSSKLRPFCFRDRFPAVL